MRSGITLLEQEGCTTRPAVVSSNPTRSVILWFPLSHTKKVLLQPYQWYPCCLELEQMEIFFPVIKSLILTLPSNWLSSSCLDTYSVLGNQPYVRWWTGTETMQGKGWSLAYATLPHVCEAWNWISSGLKNYAFHLNLYMYSWMGEFDCAIDNLVRTKAYHVKTKLLHVYLRQEWWLNTCLFCIALSPTRFSCGLHPSHAKAWNGHACLILSFLNKSFCYYCHQ